MSGAPNEKHIPLDRELVQRYAGLAMQSIIGLGWGVKEKGGELTEEMLQTISRRSFDLAVAMATEEIWRFNPDLRGVLPPRWMVTAERSSG